MPRQYYDEQLAELKNHMLQLADMVETAIQEAVQALISQDAKKAEEIKKGDAEIDDQVHTIERLCYSILLRQSPVATDLREVSAALKMITDMERIGDHAEDISELTILMAGGAYPDIIKTVKKMADVVILMLREAVVSYLEKDTEKACWVIGKDDEADALFDTVKASIETLIRSGQSDAEQALDILMTAKYFERIGDHATNLAEGVLFYLTGKLPDD